MFIYTRFLTPTKFFTPAFFSILLLFSDIFNRLLFFVKRSIESLVVRNIAIVYKKSNKHIKGRLTFSLLIENGVNIQAYGFTVCFWSLQYTSNLPVFPFLFSFLLMLFRFYAQSKIGISIL